MICNLLLSYTLFLLSVSSLLAYPVSDVADMLYSRPGSLEEVGAVGPDELSVSGINGLLLQRAAAPGFSPLLFRQGLTVTGPLPKEALKEVLLEKPSLLSSTSHLLGIKRPYRRRASRTECFWKYCV
ncbi:urotensin 2, alpha [Electrophorus electricus]|uniref:Urotensin 2, alpha n=1 Tax=Electrophorus electricus TaxID=8005 RepID=A0A4W4HI80_ELEEL|nr:urotensin 2, alpha [Electrophorus electricus]